MKFAQVITVEGRFIVEVQAANKAEEAEKVRHFTEGQDLVIKDQGDMLSIRSVK